MANTQKKEASVAGSKSVVLTSIICALLLIGVIVWAAFTKAEKSMRNKIAMTVGDYKISGVEFEYQYKDTISTFQSENSEIISYLGVDFEKDLSAQMYSEEMSWKDYFIDSTVKKITEQYLIMNEADSEGFKLTDEEKKSALSELESLRNMLNSYGIGFDTYITATYGKDIKYSDMEKFSLDTTFAYNYLLKVLDSFGINDSDINEYYNANKDSLDTVAFHSYQFAYTVPSDITEGDESYKAEAKAK